MSQKIDWGVPDWANLDGYPAPGGPQEICIWAWEFLRRWDEYRTFWKEKIEPFIEVPGAHLTPHNKLEARLVSGGISRDADGNFWPHHDELKKRFGVDVPSPPQSPTPSFFIERYTTWAEGEGGETQQICLEKHQIAMIFDLSIPLEAQFKRALASAKVEQEFRGTKPNKARRRAERYVQYLRVLDAIDSGAKPKDIAATLFPALSNEHPDYCGNIRVCDYRQAAEKLRDGGYRSLLVA